MTMWAEHERKHHVEVCGIWHNDGEAGVGLWCSDCEMSFGDDRYSMTLDEITAAIQRHEEGR